MVGGATGTKILMMINTALTVKLCLTKKNCIMKSAIKLKSAKEYARMVNYDKIKQATGYGIDDKQVEAYNQLLDKTIYGKRADEYPFFPIDITSFSRGATTGSDFINKIDNENYWNYGLLTRSHMMFDPVGSYDLAGNGIDLGRDFSTPKNIVAIQINANNENRNLFDLQSLRDSQGNLAGKYWHEINLDGAHATIGGGYKEGEQGKTLDMTKYAMQTMVNYARNYGVEFNDIPQNHLPSQEFSQIMNIYNKAKFNAVANPTSQNQVKFESIKNFINDATVHNSSWQINDPLQIHNYDIGNERGVYYPNDKYLEEK